jgi:hypothetical protein
MKDLWAFNDQSPGKKNLAGAEALGIDVRRNSVKSVHCSNAENGLSLCAASRVTDLLYIRQKATERSCTLMIRLEKRFELLGVCSED